MPSWSSSQLGTLGSFELIQGVGTNNLFKSAVMVNELYSSNWNSQAAPIPKLVGIKSLLAELVYEILVPKLVIAAPIVRSVWLPESSMSFFQVNPKSTAPAVPGFISIAPTRWPAARLE